MRILEELGTFIVSLALAVALLGVAAVMLYYFNPQQPLDHAKAAFYPLVKPLNATHVWLGVKPSADKVEVVELKYQYRGRWADVPVARLTADGAVWLNATDGRPAAVPCSANVTVATRYGTATRAVSFTPVCLQRQAQIRDDLTVLLEQMVSYGSYVLDYVVYKSVPVLTAYFGFGSMHIGFQNVGPFPYVAINESLSGAGPWPPSFKALPLTPDRNESIIKIPTACDFVSDSSVCGETYRWLNIYVYCNDTLEIWINNARVYNGTPPATAAEYTAPQGFTAAFDPGAGTLTIKYPSLSKVCKKHRDPATGATITRCFITQEWRTALSLSVGRGSTQWWGWVRMVNASGPLSPFAINQTWSVMPAGPYVGWSGGFELFGVIPPFEVYSVYAAINGSGLVVRVGDPNCGLSEQCIRTFFYPQPGAYRIDTGVNVSAPVYNRLDRHIDTKIPLGLPIYIDQHYFIAVTSTFRRDNTVYATISWYVPDVFNVIIGNNVFYVGSGPYTCYIQTSWLRNEVPFRHGHYWQIECGRRQWYGWTSLGVIKLVFNNNYTISVYKDEQHLYTVGPLNTCNVNGCITAPTQKLTIPVYWGPGGIILGIVPFRYNPGSISYGGMIYKHGMQTAATPFYYKYNLTGAYPYRLEVKIDTARRWLYGDLYNVTYSGYLKLYLGDKLVAYDAFYGWMYKLNPPPTDGPVTKPSDTCVPQKDAKRKGIIHRDLQKGEDSYSVEVLKRFEMREFGCGIDRRYEETLRADVATVTGTSYHVKDPRNRVCGFKEARNCHGVVYCDVCPGRPTE